MNNLDLFFRGFALLLALFFTFTFIGKVAVFCVNCLKNPSEQYEISIAQSFLPAFFWVLFFMLMVDTH